MSRLFLILLLVCVASATKCIIRDDKDEPEVHVIHLDDDSGDSEDPEVVTLHIPSNRRKRQVDESCKMDTDCAAGQVCVPYIGCVKGRRKSRSLEKRGTT